MPARKGRCRRELSLAPQDRGRTPPMEPILTPKSRLVCEERSSEDSRRPPRNVHSQGQLQAENNRHTILAIPQPVKPKAGSRAEPLDRSRSSSVASPANSLVAHT